MVALQRAYFEVHGHGYVRRFEICKAKVAAEGAVLQCCSLDAEACNLAAAAPMDEAYAVLGMPGRRETVVRCWPGRQATDAARFHMCILKPTCCMA